jgi:hypothetical protein
LRPYVIVLKAPARNRVLEKSRLRKFKRRAPSSSRKVNSFITARVCPTLGKTAGYDNKCSNIKRSRANALSIVTWFASAYEKGRLTSWRNSYALPLSRVQKAGAVSLIKFSVQDYDYARTRRMASTKDIALGVYDAYFEEAAEAVRDFGAPVFISINHEMNGDWYPFSEAFPKSGVTTQHYIASWRRIVEIFRRKKADNAAFVWSPNVPDVGPIPFAKYYPGDEYVDWVGVSFYSGNADLQSRHDLRNLRRTKTDLHHRMGDVARKKPVQRCVRGRRKMDSGLLRGTVEKLSARQSHFVVSVGQNRRQSLVAARADQAKAYNKQIQNPRYIGSSPRIAGDTPRLAEQTPLQKTPDEIVLREAVRREDVKVEHPRARRPKLKIVPRQPSYR